MKTILDFINKAYAFVKKYLLLILIALIIILFFMWKAERNKVATSAAKLQTEEKFRSALLDTITVHKNKEGQLVLEKKTLQVTTEELQKNVGELNASQKELLSRIKNVEKNNTLIAAALIKTTVKIDSMNSIMSASIDTTKNTIAFNDSTKDVKFSFLVEKVKPVSLFTKPMLTIKKLELPNTQYVEFHWKDSKKEGNPVAFSVTNSNQFFKTYDINSYAIPAINKDVLAPNVFQKFWTWTKTNGAKITWCGVGIAAAVVVLKVLKL